MGEWGEGVGVEKRIEINGDCLSDDPEKRMRWFEEMGRRVRRISADELEMGRLVGRGGMHEIYEADWDSRRVAVRLFNNGIMEMRPDAIEHDALAGILGLEVASFLLSNNFIKPFGLLVGEEGKVLGEVTELVGGVIPLSAWESGVEGSLFEAHKEINGMRLRPEFFWELRRVVGVLMENNLPFADLRMENVLVREGKSGLAEPLIVDFAYYVGGSRWGEVKPISQINELMLKTTTRWEMGFFDDLLFQSSRWYRFRNE